MDHPELVRMAQAGAAANPDPAGRLGAERSVRADQLAEALPDHELHHEEVDAVLHEEIVHEDEVRVPQAHGDPGLPLKALHGVGEVQALPVDHLEGTWLPQQDVLGAVDGSHASAAQELHDA